MSESIKPPQFVPDWIRAHVWIIHKLAEPLGQQGTIVATGFGEDPSQIDSQTEKPGLALKPKVIHASIGNVQQTLDGLAQFIEKPHYNIYMPLAVFRPDLPSWAKGFERDIIACLGIVADFDDPDASRWADRLPISPNYVLQTSAGRFQAFYLFDKPEPLEAVKPVAERLKAFARCDHGTSDMSHVWRVPGAWNWPNAKKVAGGRSPEPQLVRVVKWDDSRTSLQALSNALPPGAPSVAKNASTSRETQVSTPAGHQQAAIAKTSSPSSAAIDGTPENLDAQQRMLSLPPELQEEIKRPAVGDRSKAIFRVVAELIRLGLDDKAIENIIYAHPKGIGEKYAGRDDLDKDIARIRTKTASRPIVQLREGQLPWVVDEAEQYLIDSDQEVFQRGSLIVRSVQDNVIVTKGRQISSTRLAEVRLHNMRETLSRVIDFQKFLQRGGNRSWISVNCPREIAETYLQREGQWRLPALARIINAPTLRADGSILEEPGYDEATGLLFEPQGVQFPPVPMKPDFDQVLKAAQLLSQLLETFPFVGGHSRAVAFSAILTSLIRPALPSAPLHAFSAPAAGSGKSLLMDIASMIATGHETPVMAQGKTAEEFEKRLGAALVAGDGTIAIDNCEQPLGGDLLCQVLTQKVVNIRILGQSKQAQVPTNLCVFATGNNLRIIGDATRRAIVCSLDPGVERPELRSFDVDVLELTRQNRPQYVVAALTLLRYAMIEQQALSAAWTPTTLGSFEEWSRWVRPIASWLAGADPCATMERAKAQDPELESLANVLCYWHAVIGDKPVTVSEVIEIAARQNSHSPFDADAKRFVNDAFREALLVVAGTAGCINNYRLGNWLGRYRDRVARGKKIISATKDDGYGRWRVVRVLD